MIEQLIYQSSEDTVGQALVKFDARFSGDVSRLQDVVMSFDVSDTNEPTVELQKRFLRTWLRLLDKEIEKL